MSKVSSVRLNLERTRSILGVKNDSLARNGRTRVNIEDKKQI